MITCFNEGKTVGFISFYDGTPLPPPEILTHGVMKVYFHYDRAMEIINTIRYEKPLFLSVYEDKGVLSTVREPVGEQEGHQ